jgi:hypothetical protein
MLITSVCVFCECVADNDILTWGYAIKCFGIGIEELNVLLEFDPILARLIDCWKYLLLPSLPMLKTKLGFAFESRVWDHCILYIFCFE